MVFVEKNGKATMEVLGSNEKKVTYINIKIGDKFYSTTFPGNLNLKDIESSREEITNTTNIGKEKCLWILGKFTETNKHQKLPEPLPFNLHIYSEDIKDESN